ncbi:MAG: thioredoxin domain-containing protein [Deltaproteobacteria bacterium]|nr:thioredoxin domain-containing protein [Nannocystaceae bacterium]
MNARIFALVVLGLVACKDKASEAARDREYAALPGPADVDGRFDAMIHGERAPVPLEPGDMITGAAEPLVTIVEYSDFQCPFCGQFANTLEELVAAYPDDVRVVFRQFPLPMHPDAELGARAAVAAGDQGRFWAMHDLLFEHRSEMKREHALEHAKALGLDTDAFEAALDDPALAERVAAQKQGGIALGVRGTPSWFANGVYVSGALKPDALTALIERERELGRSLVEAGSKRSEIYARILHAAAAGSVKPAQ